MTFMKHVIHIAMGRDRWVASIGNGKERITGDGHTPEVALAEMMQASKARREAQGSGAPVASKSKRKLLANAVREEKLEALQALYERIDELSEELELEPRGSLAAMQGLMFNPNEVDGQSRMAVVMPDGTGRLALVDLAPSADGDGTFELDQGAEGYESIEVIRQDLKEWHGGLTWL